MTNSSSSSSPSSEAAGAVSPSLYSVDEAVWVEQRGVWYKAKVLQVRDAQQLKDKDDVEHARYWEVHYMGWHERWDMWVGVKETKKATS